MAMLASACILLPSDEAGAAALMLRDRHRTFEWTLDARVHYPVVEEGLAVDDVEAEILEIATERTTRGGSFATAIEAITCASRPNVVPSRRSAAVGFRVARTLSD